MDTVVAATLALFSVSALLNIFIAAAGLGLVIFFHELGHFLVAKWCGVYVERFSIGFGQPILAKKWGETEYWLGWAPFGGYVKMLGQDDMDPGQMTDDQISADPRSYTSKTVPQRMAIISAGVIMNIITGFLFFAIAFNSGVETTDRVIGHVQVGMPGWQHGIRSGDTITAINGRQVSNFEDLLRGTALSRGPIRLEGFHSDGETFDIELEPSANGIVRQIGIGQARSLEVLPVPDPKAIPYVFPGTAASRAEFEPGDIISAVDGVVIKEFSELDKILNEKADEALGLTVKRKSEGGDTKEVQVNLPAEQFLGLGLRMGMGKIEAIQLGSAAAEAGLKKGDLIAKVDGLDVGHDIDPVRLTEYFSEHAGEEVEVTISREVSGGAPQELVLTLTPSDRAPWAEPPLSEGAPLSVPSIGVAFHLVPNVFSVDEDGPAAGQGIKPRDTIHKVTLIRAPGTEQDARTDTRFEIPIQDKNWAYAFWTIQEYTRSRIVELTVSSPEDSNEHRVVEVTPKVVEDWYLPTTRGLRLNQNLITLKADSVQNAFAMAGRYTITSIEDIYLTLRGLLTGDISPKGLSGPINIAKLAYGFADLGIGDFLRFLGLISVNLAVINFLPIPVLDGGHMVFLIWEAVTRKKPSEMVVATATYFGMAFVLGLMIFVIYLDLFVSKI
ncbi:site-2 protease family protein [Thalassoglobus sp. JC818]|uniref:site-2 protease family protein n=1 Tax=Thalassoglobus sp. JC818 TaxID=3232136 RepID=UPI00345B0432